jgi:hypothetical protein
MKEISINLKEFANRTSVVDTVLNHVSSTMEESRSLTKFLSGHFEKIESSGNAALSAVSLTDSHFREAIEKLTVEIDERISGINKKGSLHESLLRGIYDKIGKELNEITSQHLDQFKAAYANVVPHFEQLDNLSELLPIKRAIESNSEGIKHVTVSNNRSLNNLEVLSSTLNQIKQDMTNTSLAHRLDSIESELKKRPTRRERNTDNTNPPPKPTLRARIGNMFRRKKSGETKKGRNNSQMVSSQAKNQGAEG